KIVLSGLIDAQQENLISVDNEMSLKNIAIDSIFYVFENFNQTFLEDKHLQGKVDAKIISTLTFDSFLRLNPSSLESKIATTIRGGELNNFAPILRLERYVDDEKLSHLTFSDISTDILIKDKTVYFPEIEVNSNVSSLNISGTHTFDQRINYKIITPLRRKEKRDKDEAFGAIEETSSGKTLVHLKITGTTSNYAVAYDKEAVKNKIVSDLKKEMEELKEAFKNKGLKEKKKVELEEDDYFDWEENN
ncbi:MAG: AsmA-like C-terminal region-containing protein, partial [Fulvivirga sp.]|uniref:AsmA-like C-terminal region-containing protein n=1 Tax=Fulvivirga sp. TaxID=1931237 RepID=UPI0032EEEAA6